jgi:hypothetical protein
MPVLVAEETPAPVELAVHPLSEQALGRLRRWFPAL